jgi:hypothetical protein
MRITEAHLRWLVLLISAHSLGVGAILLLVPEWAVRFAGWPGVDPVFFARQAGIFHVVLVAGYLIEYYRYRGVVLMVTAKSIAVVFLVGLWLIDDTPWAVPFSGVADGIMGGLVWLAARSARPAPPPPPSR